MKYRVKQIGDKYYIQYSSFIIWHFQEIENDQDGELFVYSYNSLEAAKNVIRDLKAGNVSVCYETINHY